MDEFCYEDNMKMQSFDIVTSSENHFQKTHVEYIENYLLGQESICLTNNCDVKFQSFSAPQIL